MTGVTDVQITADVGQFCEAWGIQHATVSYVGKQQKPYFGAAYAVVTRCMRWDVPDMGESI